MHEQLQLGFGASTATLTITVPRLSEEGISPLLGTRLRYPTVRGDLGDPNNRNRLNLRQVLPAIHEYAHFFDLYSTDIGFALSLVDHLRISKNIFLLSRLKEYPVAPKIPLPLVDGVLQKRGINPSLENLALIHRDIRQELINLWVLSFADIGILNPNHQQWLLQQYDQALSDPLYGQLFMHFSRTTEDMRELASKRRCLPVYALLEISAHLAVMAFLMINMGMPLERASDIARRFAPQLKGIHEFVVRYLEEGYDPAVVRFLIWRCLHGRLVRLSSGDKDIAQFSEEHPSMRFARLTDALLQEGFPTPPFSVGSIDEIPSTARTFFEEVDEQVVEKLGFAPLSTVSRRWLSASPLGSLVFEPPSDYARDWEVFTYRSKDLMRHGVRGIKALHSHPEAMLTLLLLGSALPNFPVVEFGPVAVLDGGSPILSGKEAESDRDARILGDNIFFNLLLLELDSDHPTEMWDWLAAIARGRQTSRESLVDEFLDQYNLAFDDIEWGDRIPV